MGAQILALHQPFGRVGFHSFIFGAAAWRRWVSLTAGQRGHPWWIWV